MECIILFYKYIPISNPHGIKKWQDKICADLHLKGRIILATEGINGTLGGDSISISRYIEIMKRHPLFQAIDFKQSEGSKEHFPRLSIKVRKEIVTLGKKIASLDKPGVHKTPAQVHALIKEENKDLLIFDARNRAEWQVGRFQNALTAPIEHFRELPDFIDNNIDQFRDKHVLMYCTGGIRCEKASAYLKEKGVAKEVMQLEGGIVRYTEQYPNGFFRGKNYVFDGRVTVQINDDVLGICFICQNKANDYVNCPISSCNRHFICCSLCTIQYENYCSSTCKESNSVLQ